MSSSPEARRLTAAYKRELTRVRLMTGQAASSAFQRIGSWTTEDDVRRFTQAAITISTAGQNRATSLTDAYMARWLTEELGEPVPHVGAAALARPPDVDPADVYRRPFVQLWGQLSKGTQFATALTMATARARQLAETDVSLAGRNASQVILGENAERVTGWQRVNANACELCSPMCEAVYSISDLMPIHPGCGCVVEPVVEHVYPKSAQEGTEDVAVHEHGELGPVLARSGDEFATPGEL